MDCSAVSCICFVQAGCSTMAPGNPFYDDLLNKPEVIDPPQSEDLMEIISESSVNDPTQIALKPNLTVSSSVRELLECPVCLNAMYPPIHQVCLCHIFQQNILVCW